MRISRVCVALLLVAGNLVLAVLSSGPANAIADLQAVAVSAGGEHTCAVTTTGALKCWGYNVDGELGDGTNVDRIEPVDVTGLGSGVAAVSAFGDDTCALTTGGAVKCWGLGRLGDGNTYGSNVPVDVTGLGSGVAQVATGGPGACALTTGGAVKCWGNDNAGQLGDGPANTDGLVPVDVVGLGSGVVAISMGNAYGCAQLATGAVKCWGANEWGELGDGTTTNRNAPVAVVGLGSGVAEIVAGQYHTCALMTDASAECWGRNDNGQLGDGTLVDRDAPVDVDVIDTDVQAVVPQALGTCAIATDGGVECWGPNAFGQLGDATTVDSRTSVAVAGLDAGAVALTKGGEGHTCALTADGAVRCWGSNASGELGAGTARQVFTPIDIGGFAAPVMSVDAGGLHTCAVDSTGGATCWGENSEGQLGDGTTLERHRPTVVTGLGSGVAAVAAGLRHTCALTTAGAAMCWGRNDEGQLGDGTTIDRDVPVAVVGLESGVVAISAGWSNTCALTASGAVMCWGDNSAAELGDGTHNTRTKPSTVVGLGSGVSDISTNGGHSCAVTSTGAAKCWGGNGTGALGDGTNVESSVPVDVSGLGSGVSQMATGRDSTCALTDAGSVLCWGAVDGGFQFTPVAVSGLTSDVATITAGDTHTCALTTGGALKCWGNNTAGQLGIGPGANSAPNVPIGLGSGVGSATAGGDHTCAALVGGSLECWGGNLYGQLGNGLAGYSTVPVGVVGLGLDGASTATAPTDVSVSAAISAVNATWTPPTDDGGAPVYGYAVTVTDGSGATAAGVSGSKVRATFDGAQFHFAGLSSGHKYRLDVAPLNRAGVGASILSAVVQPHVSPPTPTPKPNGYWMVGATGTVYPFGHVANSGSATTLGVTHIEPTPTGRGYWVVNAGGSVYAFGDAKRLPAADALATGESVVGLSSSASGRGYLLITDRGRVMSRGDAGFRGDMSTSTLNGRIVGSVATPDGHGYYMVGSDGGVFAFGSAKFYGSMGSTHLNRPVKTLVATADGKGYWLVASDGGVFAFGDARFRGSMGGTRLNRPVVGAARYGDGYLMIGSDGGVFDFSNRPFAGSLGAIPPVYPIVSVAATR